MNYDYFIGILPFSLPMSNRLTNPTSPITPWLAILKILLGFSKMN